MVPAGDSRSVEDFFDLENFDAVNDIVKVPNADEPLKCKFSKTLPKLKAPLDMENEDKFWQARNLREQVKIYFTYLKWKKSKGKPVWWPTCLSFDRFHHVSHNTVRQNKLIVKAILEHFYLNPETHCEYPEMPEKKKTKKMSKQVYDEEEDVEEDVDAPDLNNSHNSGDKRKQPQQEVESEDEEVQDRIKNKGQLRKMRREAPLSQPSSSHSPSRSSCSPSRSSRSPSRSSHSQSRSPPPPEHPVSRTPSLTPPPPEHPASRTPSLTPPPPEHPASRTPSLTPPPPEHPAPQKSPSPDYLFKGRKSKRQIWKCNMCNKGFPTMRQRNSHQEDTFCKNYQHK